MVCGQKQPLNDYNRIQQYNGQRPKLVDLTKICVALNSGPCRGSNLALTGLSSGYAVLRAVSPYAAPRRNVVSVRAGRWGRSDFPPI